MATREQLLSQLRTLDDCNQHSWNIINELYKDSPSLFGLVVMNLMENENSALIDIASSVIIFNHFADALVDLGNDTTSTSDAIVGKLESLIQDHLQLCIEYKLSYNSALYVFSANLSQSHGQILNSRVMPRFLARTEKKLTNIYNALSPELIADKTSIPYLISQP